MHAIETAFYPPIDCYNSGHLEVGQGHSIYFEESGNKDGIPVIYMHGGPGYWANPNHRRYFHPDKYRIILHHQRGCGLSTPLGSLKNNETKDLLSDLDKLREHLNIDKCVVFGGSWGSTLSLLYAQHAPDKVMGIVVSGIYLADKEWSGWYLEDKGAEYFFPEEYETLKKALPARYRGALASAVLKETKKNNNNNKVGQAVVDWETVLVHSRFSLFPKDKGGMAKDFFDGDEDEAKKKQAAAYEAAGIIEMHYLAKQCFLKNEQILKNADRIAHIPCMIIHGRYDMVCPPKQAYLLHKALPNSILNIVGDAGHHSREIRPYLVKAMDVFDPVKGFDVLKVSEKS